MKKDILNILLKETLASVSPDMQYNLHFGGYFYDGIYKTGRGLQGFPLQEAVSQCFRKAVRMNHVAADCVNIIERRRESNFSSNKLQTHVSVIRKRRVKQTNETSQSQIRISYYSNKKYIHTEI